MLLHRDSLRTVGAAISKAERVKEHLAGVRIEPDGSSVATDGHILLKFTPSTQPDPKDYPVLEGVDAEDNGGTLKPFTLPSEAAIEILRAIPKRGCPAMIGEYVVLDVPKTNERETAVIGLTDLESSKVFKPRKAQGDFPSYQKLFDSLHQKEVVAEFALTLEVVLKLLKTFKDLEVKRFKVKVRGADEALEIETKNENGEVRALIMPCTIDWQPQSSVPLEEVSDGKKGDETEGHAEGRDVSGPV